MSELHKQRGGMPSLPRSSGLLEDLDVRMAHLREQLKELSRQRAREMERLYRQFPWVKAARKTSQQKADLRRKFRSAGLDPNDA